MKSQHQLIALTACLSLLLLVLWLACQSPSPKSPDIQNQESPTPTAANAAPTIDTSPEPPKPISPPPSKNPDHLRRAYLLSLNAGQLTLQNQEDVAGDFAQPKKKRQTWPGMLRCQLRDKTGSLLAEEIMRAPDALCSGPVSLNHPAPNSPPPIRPVIFQTRLPLVATATHLQVWRVLAPESSQPDLLLGSIPLTTR